MDRGEHVLAGIAEGLARAISGQLHDGETLNFVTSGSGLKPALIFLTSHRLLIAQTGPRAKKGNFLFSANLEEIVSFEVREEKGRFAPTRSVAIRTNENHFETSLSALDIGHLQTGIPVTASSPTSENLKTVIPNTANYGQQVLDERFGTYAVALYANGYVRIGRLFADGPIEKLKGVTAHANVVSKTALGRFVVGVATAGINTVLPGNRGKLHLVLVTDQQVHNLVLEAAPTDKDMRAFYKIEATAKALVDSQSASIAAPTRADDKSVSEQLLEISNLHAQGLLTEEEFAAAKAQVLKLKN